MIIPLKQAVVLVVFFFSLLLSLKAQDVPYSQYYSNLVYLNPAFAGTRTESRVNMFYRNQWPRSNAGFQSFGIAYDMPIQNSNSGFGVMLTNDMAGGFVEPSFDIIYSHHVKLIKKMYLSLALQAGIVQKYLKPLDFGATQEITNGFSKIYPDFALGVSTFYKSVYTGLSVDHLVRPYQGTKKTNEERLNRKYTFFIGYIFHLNERLIREERIISPNLLIQIQGMQQNICLGSSFQYDNLLGGLWMRNNLSFNPDALIFMLGYKTKSMRFTYSYDMNLGKKTTIPLGAHEVSFSLLFKTKSKKKFNAIKCPTFLL
ncbi:MAG: type IX secretion system membrane protein PorP/SprF [Salinivirgaceae bacterium]